MSARAQPTSLVRYLAPFRIECTDQARLILARWPSGIDGADRVRYAETCEFFLEPVRPIFEVRSNGAPNRRGVRILRHPTDSRVSLYLFRHTLGLMVIERPLPAQTESSGETIGPEVGRMASQSGPPDNIWHQAADLVKSLGGEFYVYTRRLLTWVLWVEHAPRPLTTRARRRQASALTEHEELDGLDSFTHSGLVELFRLQGLERWRGWTVLYSRDNVAAVVYTSALSTRRLGRVVTMHKEDLFRLYLLCLYNKLRLIELMTALVQDDSAEMVDSVDRVRIGNRWRLYDTLHSQDLEFRNHFRFAEVSRNTTGRLVYPRMVHALGIRELAAEVEDELAILRLHYERQMETEHHRAEAEERRQERLIQREINILTKWLLPASIVTGALGMNILVPTDVGFLASVTIFIATTAAVLYSIRGIRRLESFSSNELFRDREG